MTPNDMSARRVVTPLGDLSLAQALVGFARQAGTAAVGYAYRPTAATWFRLDGDGVPATPDDPAMDLAGVFELRAFTATQELRWHNVSAGSGPAVVVAEAVASGSGDRPIRFQPYERLLWGTVTRADHRPGWAVIHDGRIGSFNVPVDGTPDPGDRVWLAAVEYIAEDEFGNVAVVDERLTSLTVRRSPTRLREGAQG